MDPQAGRVWPGHDDGGLLGDTDRGALRGGADRGGGTVSGIYWTDALQPIYEAGPFWNNGRWA